VWVVLRRRDHPDPRRSALARECARPCASMSDEPPLSRASALLQTSGRAPRTDKNQSARVRTSYLSIHPAAWKNVLKIVSAPYLRTVFRNEQASRVHRNDPEQRR
jgi:hypothetical protein